MYVREGRNKELSMDVKFKDCVYIWCSSASLPASFVGVLNEVYWASVSKLKGFKAWVKSVFGAYD